MKFHRFPYLVQQNLCSILHPIEVLLLSECSNRTRRAVKKTIPKNEVVKTEIWVSGNKTSMTISYRNKEKFVYMSSREWPPIPRRVIWIEIDGVDVGISWKEEASNFCSIQVHNQRHAILIYKCICNLFNALEEVYVKTDQLEYQFPSVKRSFLSHSGYTTDRLEKFYRINPEQQFSEVKCSRELSISDRENVFVVRNLILRETIIPNAWQCFRMFKGEHAYFECTYMSVLGIIYISKMWMVRLNDGLKSVIFKPKKNYDVQELKREIRVISCGMERKQDVYAYKSIITEYENFPSYIFDCTDGIDIKRDTDGKMATITLFPDYVTFFVWD
ncbi:hypothetical protein CAEBREN_11780 [Caenorhabditis brenneri]|uniref:F-box domain-containing protein n=1 Tax=Caenorhabditis brenneri TaxID=135651 RepID=G0NNW6_CAEBE|nr:hypothetical protein CAEBREN_11780 [Caenorhabditis brenneri]